MTDSAKRHFTDLDGMRGVLALVVMLFHLGLNGLVTRATAGLLPGGVWTLCVDFFFTLSGFVLYVSMAKSRLGLALYFKKRYRRLAPVFLLTLASMLVLAPASYRLSTVLLNAFMIQSFVPGAISIDHPAWSIPFELFLPAFAVPLVSVVRNADRKWLLFALIVLLCLDALFDYQLALDRDFRLVRAVLGLATGMTLGMLASFGLPDKSRPLLIPFLAGVALLIMLFAMAAPPVAMLFHGVAVAAIFWGAHTRSLFSTRPLQALGKWSYSIYLWHIPVLAYVTRFVGSADGNVALKALVVVLTLLLSAITYRWIEVPMMGYGFRTPAQTAP